CPAARLRRRRRARYPPVPWCRTSGPAFPRSVLPPRAQSSFEPSSPSPQCLIDTRYCVNTLFVPQEQVYRDRKFRGSRSMLLGEVIGRLHLDQARGRAAEVEGLLPLRIEPIRHVRRSHDELAAMLVELVDEQDEAPRLVALLARKKRHAVEDHGVEMPGNGL